MVVRSSTDGPSLGREQALGAVGAAVVVIGGLLAGVVPVGERLEEVPGLRELREQTALSVSVV